MDAALPDLLGEGDWPVEPQQGQVVVESAVAVLGVYDDPVHPPLLLPTLRAGVVVVPQHQHQLVDTLPVSVVGEEEGRTITCRHSERRWPPSGGRAGPPHSGGWSR